MFKVKKKLLYFAMIIVGIIVVQVICFNYNYISSFKNPGPSELLLSDAVAKDLESEGKGYISTSNDPWLEFSEINKRINKIKIEATYENNNSLVQVFYKTDINMPYTEENSKVVQTKRGDNEVEIDLDNLTIQSIRLDITNTINDKIIIDSVVLNPKLNFTWNGIEILKNTSILLFVIFLIYVIIKRINFIIKYRYPLAGILFIILVLLKLHGSSIGMWDQYITEKIDPDKHTTLIGTERPIRSDEWLVQTPYMLSQAKNADFNHYNSDLIRSDGQNMVLANAPTYTIESLGKPFYWGYLLFGGDYGLSWFWYSKLILLLLLSFEISMFLTRNNKIVSVLGSLWIAFSPTIQWWYTTGAGVVELIVYSQAIITCGIYYFKTEKVRNKILLWGLATISFLGFVYTLYPAVQVPLMFLILLFLAVIISENYKNFKVNKIELCFLAAFIAVAIYSVYSFVGNSMPDIHLMLNTIYPGKRTITGGEYSFADLQLFLMSWLLPYKDTTFSNNSSISSLFNLLPVIIISCIFVFKKVENKRISIFLLGYLLFQLSWLFIKYPTFIAKITLFSFVPEVRLAGITFGITAVYLSIWFCSEILRLNPFSLKQCVIFCVLILLLYVYSVYTSEMHNYLGIFTIISVLYYVLIHFFLLKGMKKAFIVSLVTIILISGLTVNPIARGTGSIYNKKIAHAIESINENDLNQKWAATDSVANGQYLLALGVKSFNSVQYYPDLEMWNDLDESNQFIDVYNRYAHVVLTLTHQKTEFVLDQADKFTLKLNVSDLPKTGIKYVLATNSLEEYKELEEMFFEPEGNLYIYKVK